MKILASPLILSILLSCRTTTSAYIVTVGSHPIEHSAKLYKKHKLGNTYHLQGTNWFYSEVDSTISNRDGDILRMPVTVDSIDLINKLKNN